MCSNGSSLYLTRGIWYRFTFMINKNVPDSFAVRMKSYESVSQLTLMHRTPVIVRVDGKNFSKLTRSMRKPFDRGLTECMHAAAHRLVTEAQNCRFAYVQSDEISLLLTDFRTLTTDPWFANSVQKICSISSALATSGFCEEFIKQFPDRTESGKFPVFDARCFNLPREEVANYFVWRQRDAERNSVSMAAQACFSQKELQGADRSQMLEMLMLKKGINWNDYDAAFKRGSVMTKETFTSAQSLTTGVQTAVVRARWVSADAPIFSKERDFIERFLRDEEVRISKL